MGGIVVLMVFALMWTCTKTPSMRETARTGVAVQEDTFSTAPAVLVPTVAQSMMSMGDGLAALVLEESTL